MRTKNLISWLLLIGFLVAIGLGVSNYQSIYDWWKLRDYDPSDRVVELADNTTMDDDTRRVFYVNHPELNDKQEFNHHCQAVEQTIVLGCFIDNQGIYLLNVTEPKLNGVVEVTAAHEVLHAMYERLSDSEREEVDKMTSEFFAGLKNERIRKTIESYRSNDPSIVPNELHSILGTEVRDLSPELENYYKRYFSNRGKIVDYSEKYEQTFIGLESKAEQYDRRLDELKQEIDTNKEILDAQSQEINEKQSQLDELRRSDQIEEYNAQIPVYNSAINEYNVLVNQTRQAIDEYNSLLKERNQLVIQQQQLYQAIDSNSLNEKAR